MTRSGFELYLVRHAIAAERGSRWPDDTLRPLTREGISRFKDVVKEVARLGLMLDVIFTSPLTRARQTAELLAEGLPQRPDLRIMKALAPGSAPEDVVAA